MINNLQNKTAIITGASNGIGMEIGKKFLQAGANVVFSDSAKFDLETLISGVSPDIRNAHSFYGNMHDKLAVNNLIATTLNKFERIDILVNANRTIIPSNPLDEKEGALEKSLSQNIIATLNVSQLFAKSVIKQTKNRKNGEIAGSIINLTSIAANQTIPEMMPYSVSCAALNQMTRSLAVSLAKDGIRVNAISLGSIMSSSLRLNLHSNPELQDSIIDATPLGYIAEPVEVADLALFLSSESASFLTGQVITIDGGRSILNNLEKAAY
jgi:7-alpha-hydroxysteroid dehydrogenase